MFLDATNLKLEATLTASATTNQPEVHVFYKLWNNKTTDTRPSCYRSTLSNTADVTILPAPTVQGTSIEIIGIHIYNKDTVLAEVTVKTDNGTDEQILVKQSVDPTSSLVWNKYAGWQAL